MEYFLVNGSIECRRYMRDGVERFESTKLVKATDKEAAREKFRQYWDDMSEAYYVSYYASNVIVDEVIE